MAWSVGAGLDGKGVIVTGAAGGIGKAVATAFSTTGARVLAVDLDQAKVDEVVAGFEGSGHLAVAADLRDLAAHQGLVDRARNELGNLYVLANLAAVLRRRGSLDEVTEDDWDFQHDVNLKAAFFLCRAAGDAMIEQGQGGRIITFSSQGWWTGGFGGSVAYAATKGGVTSMTRGLARTFGPHRHHGQRGGTRPGPYADAHDRPLARGLRVDEAADAAGLCRRARGAGRAGGVPRQSTTRGTSPARPSTSPAAS